jgi:hypothetical protein
VSKYTSTTLGKSPAGLKTTFVIPPRPFLTGGALNHLIPPVELFYIACVDRETYPNRTGVSGGCHR